MLAELRVTPVGAAIEFARLIASVLRVVADSPLQYQMHAMGTTLEGELADILDVLRRCHEEMRKNADRVLIELSLDDRSGREGELTHSLEHVRQLSLGLPVERFVEQSAR